MSEERDDPTPEAVTGVVEPVEKMEAAPERPEAIIRADERLRDADKFSANRDGKVLRLIREPQPPTED